MIFAEHASLEEKLRILSDAAKYDVACTSSGVSRQGKGSAPSSGWNSVIVPQNRFGMLVIRHRGFSRSRMAMVS